MQLDRSPVCCRLTQTIIHTLYNLESPVNQTPASACLFNGACAVFVIVYVSFLLYARGPKRADGTRYLCCRALISEEKGQNKVLKILATLWTQLRPQSYVRETLRLCATDSAIKSLTVCSNVQAEVRGPKAHTSC